MRRAPDAGTYGALALLVMLWGTAFLLMTIATREAPPLALAGWRTWIGAATALAVLGLLGRRLPRDRRVILWSLWIGLVSVALPFSLLAYAATRLPSGVIGVSMAAIPLVVLPLAHVLSPVLGLNERMTAEKTLGIGLGFAGVLALFGPEALSAFGAADQIAQLACLGAALSYAVGSLSIRAMPETDPVGAATLQLLVGSVIILPVAWSSLPTGPLLTAYGSEAWAAIIGLGLGATGIAIVLRVHIISTAGPVFMATAGYLVPLTALLVGWAIAGERFSALDLGGAALILIGVGIARGALGALGRRFRRAT